MQHIICNSFCIWLSFYDEIAIAQRTRNDFSKSGLEVSIITSHFQSSGTHTINGEDIEEFTWKWVVCSSWCRSSAICLPMNEIESFDWMWPSKMRRRTKQMPTHSICRSCGIFALGFYFPFPFSCAGCVCDSHMSACYCLNKIEWNRIEDSSKQQTYTLMHDANMMGAAEIVAHTQLKMEKSKRPRTMQRSSVGRAHLVTWVWADESRKKEKNEPEEEENKVKRNDRNLKGK